MRLEFPFIPDQFGPVKVLLPEAVKNYKSGDLM